MEPYIINNSTPKLNQIISAVRCLYFYIIIQFLASTATATTTATPGRIALAMSVCFIHQLAIILILILRVLIIIMILSTPGLILYSIVTPLFCFIGLTGNAVSLLVLMRKELKGSVYVYLSGTYCLNTEQSICY